MVLTRIIREALAESSLPEASVTYIADTDRKYVGELLTMDKYVDMIIPRGGRALAERCRKESTVPVIVGGFGVSHIFVDETADLERSLRVIENSKIQRPAACNSLDTVLVHEKIAERFLPMLAELFRKDKVKIAAEPKAYEILKRPGRRILRPLTRRPLTPSGSPSPAQSRSSQGLTVLLTTCARTERLTLTRL